MTARLPVAPPPLADEAPSSWLRRMAARYRLSLGEFVLGIAGPSATASIAVLDTAADPGVDTALEAAAGVPPGTLAGLRLPAACLWPMDRPRWCPDCIREDVALRGEIHLRAAWTFGGFMVCPAHGRSLTDTCPRCHTVLAFDATDGRLRLACPSCRTLADAGPPLTVAAANWLPVGNMNLHLRPAIVEFAARPTAAALLAQVQQDLIASAAARSPAHPAVQGMDADRLLRVVQGLVGYVLASYGCAGITVIVKDQPAETCWMRPVQAAWRGSLPRPMCLGALTVVAAVLAEAAGDPRDDMVCWVRNARALRPVRFAEIGPRTQGARSMMEDLAREAGGPLQRLLRSASGCQPQQARLRRSVPGHQQQDVRRPLPLPACEPPATAPPMPVLVCEPLAVEPTGKGHSPYAAWARALLADPKHAAQLQGKRGKERDKAIGRIARAALLRQEAAGCASLSAKRPVPTGHRAGSPTGAMAVSAAR